MLDNNRVRISLRGRLEQMVHWFLTNDPQYIGGKPQDVLEMLLERGVDAVYQEGLANADRLDPTLDDEFAKLSIHELRKVATESRDGQ